jgi:hypothetical protein
MISIFCLLSARSWPAVVCHSMLPSFYPACERHSIREYAADVFLRPCIVRVPGLTRISGQGDASAPCFPYSVWLIAAQRLFNLRVSAIGPLVSARDSQEREVDLLAFPPRTGDALPHPKRHGRAVNTRWSWDAVLKVTPRRAGRPAARRDTRQKADPQSWQSPRLAMRPTRPGALWQHSKSTRCRSPL